MDIVSALATESSFCWLLCPFDTSPTIGDFFFLTFPYLRMILPRAFILKLSRLGGWGSERQEFLCSLRSYCNYNFLYKKPTYPFYMIIHFVFSPRKLPFPSIYSNGFLISFSRELPSNSAESGLHVITYHPRTQNLPEPKTWISKHWICFSFINFANLSC